MSFPDDRVLVAAACVFAAHPAQPMEVSVSKLKYPPARISDQVDDYFGTKVADPYRWLEDPDSAETKAWVKAENKLTFGYLEKIPEREAIRKRLTALWNYERFGIPFKEGGKYFFTRNDGLQNQPVLLVAPSLKAKPRLLLDPNTMSKDGVDPVGGYSVSEDGRYLAYSKSSGGSDWQEWRIGEVATGNDLPEVLKWSKFSGASWTKDSKGFFYSRFDEPKPGSELQGANYFQKLYYHVAGTPQSEDKLVYERPDHKEWCFSGDVTEDGRYLVITAWQERPETRIFYKDLKGGDVVELLNKADAVYWFLGNDGPVFWVKTNLDAPRNRVVAIDTRKPERSNWKDVIPEAKETLQGYPGIGVVGERFFAHYLEDAHSLVRIFDLKGKLLGTVKLPGIGSAGGFGGKRKEMETFFSYTDYRTPATVYRMDLKTNQVSAFRRPKVAVRPGDYVSKQVFYHSKDGTRVPMFITYKRGLKLNGENPTLLTGYGGFDIPITPGFDVADAVWMEMGGVLAVPNLRGGGEYGKAWYDAGRLKNKQNVFDDFIAAAEWLIANKYTSTPKLAIEGGSNGGLLIGACVTQRPDLFGAALPAVGVMDMLRFQKFTIGWNWVCDYGSSDNKEDFQVQIKYSPLHNIRPGTHCPPTLVTTADHDDRVVPAHSFKFAATMQAGQGSDAPVLIRIETQSGHGATSTAKIIQEAADRWAFLVTSLGIHLPAGFGQ